MSESLSGFIFFLLTIISGVVTISGLIRTIRQKDELIHHLQDLLKEKTNKKKIE